MSNYQLEMEKAMGRVPPGTGLLLHACCAPCASVALQRLAGHFAVTLFYYNPNIAPGEEYQRRLEAMRRLVERAPAPYPVKLVEGAYRPEEIAAVAAPLAAEPEGGARCTACFALRLHAAARQAKAMGLEWFTTTLTTGPRKNAALLNQLGERAAWEQGLSWLPCDFKKKDGYRQSVALCAEYGLYRQHYCGCVYSLPDAAEE